jgi:hypothetical protein
VSRRSAVSALVPRKERVPDATRDLVVSSVPVADDETSRNCF